MTDGDDFLRGPVPAAGPPQAARVAEAADDDNFLRSSRSFRISADVTALMLKGAGYAGLVCLGILAIGLLLLALANVLPEASKEAADPTPEVSLAAPPAPLPFA